MADLLSLAASIITVVGAADTVSKTLSKIKIFLHAPEELLALNNEISDLKVVLSCINSFVTSEQSDAAAMSQDFFQHVSALLEKAKDRLLQLEQLIHFRFLKSGSLNGDYRVYRLKWVRARNTVESHRQALRDTRQNLLTQVTLINSTQQARIRLQVEEVFMISNKVQTNQTRLRHLVDQRFGVNSLSDIMSSQSDFRRVLEGIKGLLSTREQLSGQPSAIEDHSPYPIIGIRTYIPRPRQACPPSCRCSCHQFRYVNWPQSLNNMFGALFIGYSGGPSGIFRKCTEDACLAQSEFRAYVNYYFPFWFLSKVLTLTIMLGTASGPYMTLTIRRTVPGYAEIFRLCESDDATGLQNLLSTRLASPNDLLLSTGDNALAYCVTPTRMLRLNACKVLLDAGADPYYEAPGRGSAYSYAWLRIYLAAESPAILDVLRSLFPSQDHYEENKLSKLHAAVLGITSLSLEEELRISHTDVNIRDSKGMTALAWAVLRGDESKTKVLLEAGADVSICDNGQCSPLMHAARGGNYMCIDLLIEAGAEVIIEKQHWYSAVHFAAVGPGSPQILERLIAAGANVDDQDPWGITPLVYAASTNNIQTMGVLLDHGSNIENLDNEGDTPLNGAIFKCAPDVLQFLLQRGASCTTVNNNANTVLHIAASFADLKIIEILLAANIHGIDTYARTKVGKTAMQLAYERQTRSEGFLEAFKALLFEIRNRNDSMGEDQQAGRVVEVEDDSETEGAFVDAAEEQVDD